MDSPAPCPSGIGCGSIKSAASSKPRHLPSHGLKTESVPSMKPKEKTRPICPPTQSGKSVYFCGSKQPGCKRQRSTNEGGNPTPGDSKGRSPWRAFGDFPRDGKVTRGGGAERPPRIQSAAARSLPRKNNPNPVGKGGRNNSAPLVANRNRQHLQRPQQ